ncbi:2-amino-4-hydroxy-6-hydroxymethyldihydropteridine diphosphokinase [Brevibacterium litoralis]|uniref:2-amino-4-hydroxy-6- hydroxymethyldihydropteridine diphosphokinase n=1 Tax=Brevibacterium litoralis TaxID=3138935 RepID=UPI0032EB4535
MTTDSIRLTGLRARGHHGVFEHEKTDGQDFLIDVVLHTDVSPAAATDDLAHTVDYGTLAQDVVEIVGTGSLDLIETLAERIADHCVTLCPHVEVTVHKPQAPIPHAFADVSVHVERRRESTPEAPVEGTSGTGARPGDAAADAQAVIALGANLGHPVTALKEAVAALDRHPRITVTDASNVYRTAPVGVTDQPDFLNAAVSLHTELSALELLSVCQGIEVAAGRTRGVHWGPRTLDLDLVRYTPGGGDLDDPGAQTVMDTAVLTLPHPLAAARAFVLGPWRDLRPAARLVWDDGSTGPRVVPIGEAFAAAEDHAGLTPTELTLR